MNCESDFCKAKLGRRYNADAARVALPPLAMASKECRENKGKGLAWY